MVHDRVADEDGVENVVAVDAALVADLRRQIVDRLANGLGHRLAAVRVHHDVGDPAHQVLAEADLRVRGAGVARMRPDSSDTRCMAIVVEPMSQAMP